MTVLDLERKQNAAPLSEPGRIFKEIKVPLRKGANLVRVTLSNTTGTNHGAWAFAFQAFGPDGARLVPCTD